MKKFGSLLVTFSMVLALTACGGNNENTESTVESSVQVESSESQEESTLEESTVEESTVEESTEESVEESEVTGDQAFSEGALDILTTVWASYGDDEKFPAAGGDFDEANSVMDGPGRYGIQDTEALDSVFGLPASAAGQIDGAASLMHMMNANTFTCGAFHVSNADDVQAVADALKDNILQRQWMCGFPDKLVIIQIDDYVISAFGKQEPMDTFQSKTLAVYENASVLYDEPIE